MLTNFKPTLLWCIFLVCSASSAHAEDDWLIEHWPLGVFDSVYDFAITPKLASEENGACEKWYCFVENVDMVFSLNFSGSFNQSNGFKYIGTQSNKIAKQTQFEFEKQATINSQLTPQGTNFEGLYELGLNIRFKF